MEGVHNSLHALGVEFEHNTATCPAVIRACQIAAGGSNAVEIARRVQYQTAGGGAAIFSTGETVKHGLLAGRMKFEDCSAPRNRHVPLAALGSDAKKVARAVANQTVRLRSVRIVAEGVQHFVAAGRSQLKNRSTTLAVRAHR